MQAIAVVSDCFPGPEEVSPNCQRYQVLQIQDSEESSWIWPENLFPENSFTFLNMYNSYHILNIYSYIHREVQESPIIKEASFFSRQQALKDEQQGEEKIDCGDQAQLTLPEHNFFIQAQGTWQNKG